MRNLQQQKKYVVKDTIELWAQQRRSKSIRKEWKEECWRQKNMIFNFERRRDSKWEGKSKGESWKFVIMKAMGLQHTTTFSITPLAIIIIETTIPSIFSPNVAINYTWYIKKGK